MQDSNILYRRTHDAYSLMLISLVLSLLTLPLALGIILYALPKTRGSYLRSHLLYLLGNLGQLCVVLTLVILAWRWMAAQAFLTVQGNIFPPLFIYPSLVLLPIAWWVWRFVQGYRLLSAREGIARPFHLGKIRGSS